MKKEKRQATYKKCRQNAKRDNWKEEARQMSREAESMEIPESAFDYSYALKCEGCDEPFLTHTFFKHVSHSDSCKAVYGDRFTAMKKEKKAELNKITYKRNKEHFQKQKKDYDKKNAEKISERNSKKYEEKKCQSVLQKQAEEKERKLKNLKNDLDNQKSRVRRYVKIWKHCRLSDCKRFLAKAKSNEIVQEMEVKIEELCQKYETKIEITFENAKGLCEKDEKEARKLMKDLVSSFYGGEFINDILKLDKEFEEVAMNLNDYLRCFECARSELPCPKCYRPPSPEPTKKVNEKIPKMTKKPAQKENTTSSQIKEKPMIRKRKRIDFTMKDLENEAEAASDDDFVVTKKGK